MTVPVVIWAFLVIWPNSPNWGIEHFTSRAVCENVRSVTPHASGNCFEIDLDVDPSK